MGTARVSATTRVGPIASESAPVATGMIRTGVPDGAAESRNPDLILAKLYCIWNH